jgi:siroheme synthase-like protein
MVTARMPAKPYPIVLTNLDAARCVVVGGGSVAERKVEALLESAAQVTVVSPTLTARLAAWAAEGRLTHIDRPFDSSDLVDATLVIAATADREVNAEVARVAHRGRVLVNVVDDPAAGTFNTVAAVRQGDLLLGISTGGASPAVAALVQRKLAGHFGPEYSELLVILGDLRRTRMRQIPARQRSEIWRKLASDEVVEWLRTGQRARAQAYAEQLIAHARGEADTLQPLPNQECI